MVTVLVVLRELWKCRRVFSQKGRGRIVGKDLFALLLHVRSILRDILRSILRSTCMGRQLLCPSPFSTGFRNLQQEIRACSRWPCLSNH